MSGEVFKNRIRLRVNGLLKTDEAVLMVQLKSPISGEMIWMPPGGGLKFGESMKAGLHREFFEETGLEIEAGALAFVNELVKPPFHAVECYFWVHKTGGSLRLGTDPELTDNGQLLQDLKWLPVGELNEFHVVPEVLTELIPEPAPPLPFHTEPENS